MLSLKEFENVSLKNGSHFTGGREFVYALVTDTGVYKYYMEDNGSFSVEGPPVREGGEK